MSYSRSFIKFRIRLAILIIRFIGWLISGDIKRNKPKGELLKAKMLVDYFTQKYLPTVKYSNTAQLVAEKKDTIWQFWDNPAGKTTPDIVKASIESVKRFKGDFDHKILDNSTIGNYSDMPGYIFDRLKSGRMIYAHFADLLRLNLLKNHGGIWMDATLYMTNFVPKYIIDQDFFVFLTDKLTHYSYSFMQNFFIRAQKGSFLCDAWYQMCVEYWKKEFTDIDYFQHQLMFKSLVLRHPIAKELFAEMPHVSEDEVLQFVGDNLFMTFDANEWERIKKLSFFQKTTYKITGGIVADAANYQNTYFSKLCNGVL
ncbi:hypothetical protein R80B4_00769 [Fibrobacteres bacterium R8-0-B4]